LSTSPVPAGHERCGALKRDGSGEGCKLPAGHGTDHVGTGKCRRHGGNTASHKAAGKKQQAVVAVATYGLPRDVEPHTALLEELHRTAGHVGWLSLVVRELEQGELHGPVGGAQGGIPEHKPHVWVQMYAAERRHLAAVAKTCIDVGIEERRVRVVEQWGEGIAAYTRALLARLGVDLEAERTREAVSASLSLIQGGGQAA
jgi:hypothetical protein